MKLAYFEWLVDALWPTNIIGVILGQQICYKEDVYVEMV